MSSVRTRNSTLSYDEMLQAVAALPSYLLPAPLQIQVTTTFGVSYDTDLTSIEYTHQDDLFTNHPSHPLRRGNIIYINDIDVTASEDFAAFTSPPSSPSPLANDTATTTKLASVKKQLRSSARKLNFVFEKAGGTFRYKEYFRGLAKQLNESPQGPAVEGDIRPNFWEM